MTAKRIAFTEAMEDDLVGGTKAHANRVLVVYAILTGAGILLLWVEGVGFFLELSTVIKGKARFFTFNVDKEKGRRIADLDLPGNARVVCHYREGRFSLADEETRLGKGDEMVILTHSECIPDLTERWSPKETENDEP